ncbi:MAG: Nif3-like dinuclear metal center hexameric protein [Eubacteriaceae bacterium]|nr:Nif3-like dinuclear metal center hexameric protein [Eubacteriaceae bacterium]
MSAKLKDIITCLNKYYDVKTQESWDNSGLACGESDSDITNIILCLDVTDEIIDNAINAGSNLIISHHPIIFSPLYSLAEHGYKEKLLIKAIKNNIAIYCLHTPADKARNGINYANAEKLGLSNISPVKCKDNILYKIQFICKNDKLDITSEFLKKMGCFNIFTFNDATGRIVINASVTNANLDLCANTIKDTFGAETVDIYETFNLGADLCNFVIGEIEEISAYDFIKKVKIAFGLKHIFAGGYMEHSIKKVAVCGGAGKSFINDAISYGCDSYVTGDLSHHDYQMAYENKIMLIDATHYASEKVFLEIIKNTLIDEKIGFNDDNIKCVDQQEYFSKII